MSNRRKLRASVATLTLATVLTGCAVTQRSDGDADRSAERLSAEHSVAFNRAIELVYEFRYSRAAEEFDRLAGVLATLGATGKAAEAIFWRGFCHEKMGEVKQAMVLYARCVLTDPSSPAARQATARHGRLRPLLAGEANPPARTDNAPGEQTD